METSKSKKNGTK